MTPPRLSLLTAPRLFAGFGTLTLLAGIGLISSRPAHTAGGPIAVNVANTPLPMIAADDPAKQPFQVVVLLTKNGDLTAISTQVPAGKRLVVEAVSIFSDIGGDPDGHAVLLYPDATHAYHIISVPPTTAPYLGISEKTLIYVEAGDTLQATCQTTSDTAPVLYLTVSGHYVNLP